MTPQAGRREFALYLVAVTGISAASVAVLYTLFASGFTDVLSRFAQAPVSATRADPGSLALVVAGVGLPLLLVAVVVVFGATYGPDPTGASGESGTGAGDCSPAPCSGRRDTAGGNVSHF